MGRLVDYPARSVRRQGATHHQPHHPGRNQSHFETANDLEAALAALPLAREALPWDAAFLAGQAFKVYRQLMGGKTSPMPDFYIGAHALVNNLQLLTRDAARYRSYFPKLSLVAP